MTARKLALAFKEFDKNDISLVGGKGANLGEMTKAGFPVPMGFAVTVQSYEDFIEENNLKQKISDILKNLDIDKPDELNQASVSIQRIIKQGKVPEDVKREIIRQYKKLSGPFSFKSVAVRSSATAEDLPDASFAGQQATYLNVKGVANLIESVKDCWTSLFTPRAIFYRYHNKISHDKVKISVIVQLMIQSEVSGVMFTIDPVKNNKDAIIIESVWGLGELIVQGSVVPDHYVVQKNTFEILYKEISDQEVMLTRKQDKTLEIEVSKKMKNIQKISDDVIIKLAKIGQKLHDHYYFPQDIEWAFSKGKLFIVQTRPVTTIKQVDKESADPGSDFKITESPILTGSPASPGVGTGIVKIAKSPKEISKVNSGDILVSEMTSPDFVPAMKKAGAIITDKGGLTSHAAIVSRELGVPCVVGTKTATSTLKENMLVTVDGTRGLVFTGSHVVKKEIKKEVPIPNNLKTATKIYVNLAEPELASKISSKNVDGVGLLRAEFMIADIGLHPKEAIANKNQSLFVDRLAHGISKFCKEFYPKPVVYRATDFKTNEYRSLKGGQKWEPVEPNPMLGYRGAFRYIADPEVFNLELRAIKKVLENYQNLWIMIPFVRSPQELEKIRRMVSVEGLFEHPTFKFWMMVELPVNVIMIDKFIDVGIDGVSIGSNDLTMLLTGTDRDNPDVAQEFNERSPSVYWALKRTIRKCSKRGVTTSICGQAPSTYEDLVEKLVKWGVTSISVNPDAIDRVRQVVFNIEKQK